MPNHARPRRPALPRALLRATAAASSAATVLAAGGTVTANAAQADPRAATRAAGKALTRSSGVILAPAKDLRPNPLAGTGVDPLDNTVGTTVGGVGPVSTEAATGPLARGDSLRELPLAGDGAKLLPG